MSVSISSGAVSSSGFRLQKQQRLLKRADFKETLSGGKKFVRRDFVVLARPLPDSELHSCARVGFIVSKKSISKKAVTRNYVKRKFREAYRLLPSQERLYGCQIVIVARSNSVETPVPLLSESLSLGFQRLRSLLSH
ncbi:MAG: ribonuclease P protein component [Oligoflexales bacterium]|nr:ribonuclease P protein component [Oligoflexales bacterium]